MLAAAIAALFVGGLQLSAFAQAPAQQAKPADQPKPVIVCPAGQVASRHETPFGTIDVCSDPNAAAQPGAQTSAPTPAKPPATAPTTQPAPSSGVTVQTGAKPATPAAGAAATAPAQAAKPGEKQPETKAPEQKPEEKGTEQKPEPNATAQKPEEHGEVQPVGNESAVALNLENADLYQVLRILASELKLNYIVDPGVKGTVTISTASSVSRKDLFALLEMILELNGATAVKSNGYYNIVPIAGAKQLPMNFHFAKTAETEPLSQDAYTLLVVPMKFMSAAEMSKILTPFMSPAGQIVVQDKGNIMLITEGAAKLKQLQDIINVFDDPVLGRQRVRLFPVANNLAVNLVPELKSIFAAYGLSSGNSAIQFLALDRLNSILAVSPAPEVFSEVDSWIKKLDTPSQQLGVQNFVYKVENAKASDLRDIINSLYGGTNPLRSSSSDAFMQAGGATTGGTGAAGAENPATVMGPLNGGAPAPAAGAAGTAQAGAKPEAAAGAAPMGLEGRLRTMADEKNNALIIQATPHDYEIVQRTLKELDVLPRQVLIDARIYEVDLSGDLSLGISYFLDKQKNQTPITRNASFGGSGGGLTAQTFAVLPNAYQLQAFLTATENRTRVKTLSAPSILVTDNTTARIQVGSEVPVPIGSALTPVQSGGSSIFAQTIQFRDTGVILNVTPRISASGIVILQLAQEVSSAQPNATSAIVAPVISKSQFQTTAVLKNNQTLALGGIITTTNNNTRNRIPLIGDIPGVGLLFGNTSLNTTRKELVLMITPHVAQDMNDAVGLSNDLTNRMKALKNDIKKAERQSQPQTP